MSLKCGIVGLPNAGKSTLFNALTSSQTAQAANYPFCTIDPNTGMALVPDSRLQKISTIVKPEKIIPTTLEFIDIAGLVEGASKGAGLGNQFLSHIRETQALLHVVRGFDDSQITHVYGNTDPLRDIEIINTELLLADLSVAENRYERASKLSKIRADKTLKEEAQVLEEVVKILSSGRPLRSQNWSVGELSYIKSLNFISLKPVLYICNEKENQGESLKPGKSFVEMIKKQCGSMEDVLSISCVLEGQISCLDLKERSEFMSVLGLKEPALHRVIQKAYTQLNLITFFTAGPQEVRAWTAPQGSLAPQAAGVIHSDFEKGFIKAEVYSCESLFEFSSEKELKAAGLIRFEGKDYVVKDGDVIYFRFNQSGNRG